MASAAPDFASLGNGLPDMLTTDLLTTPPCAFTIVEWRRRGVVLSELELSRTEYAIRQPGSRTGT